MKTPIQLAEQSANVTAPDNYSYREREWRAPKIGEDDAIVFDEPGRVLNRKSAGQPSGGVCYRSHYLRVTKCREYGPYTLRVHHGGGEESWQLGYDKTIIEALGSLDSDSRYRLLYTIMRAHQEGERAGSEQTESKWRKAAAQKRIKTRKVKAGVKVWIEPELVTAQ